MGWQLQMAPTEPLLDRGVLVRDKLSPVSLYLSLSFAAAVGVQIVGGLFLTCLFIYPHLVSGSAVCTPASWTSPLPSPPPPPLLSYHPDKPSSLYMRCRSISTRYSLITSPPSLCPLSLSLSVCSLCVWSDHMSI